MLSKVTSAGLIGIDGFMVRIEADISDGIPGINMIGLLSSEVREAGDRVRTAAANSGFGRSIRKVTINLSPANIRKEGCGYDLAIAAAYLRSGGVIKPDASDRLISDSVFIGELSLGGDVLPVNGVLSMAMAAWKAGYANIFVPMANACEAAAIDGIHTYGVGTLGELVGILNRDLPLPPAAVYADDPMLFYDDKDFSDIHGQDMVKRAAVIAVCGRHNILFIGPPGTGKTMIASRIPTIMPLMTKQERIRVSMVYSVCGQLPKEHLLLARRPFRSPHHTISSVALSGGGNTPRPGEISMATGGVLFLDELAEFRPAAIDALRQPMESKKVMISRVYASAEYPADFMLVAATNPCKCGFYPDLERCSCTASEVRTYLGRISKPILDRIDISVETALPRYHELSSKGNGEKSEDIRRRVEHVIDIQKRRFDGLCISYNSEMNAGHIAQFCQLNDADQSFIQALYEKKGMSARGLHKILRVARTIADYEDSADIEHEHLAEAVSYRLFDDRYQKGGPRIEYGSQSAFIR